MAEIVPSILVKTGQEFKEKLELISPYFPAFHLDVADGIFVPNTTIEGAPELNASATDLAVAVHLMVSKPENHIVRWLDTAVRCIIFHLEATTTDKVISIIDAIHNGEREAGIAINPETPIDQLADYVDLIDRVHFMTVHPGFYGGEFNESVIEKIREFHYFYPDKKISVDGGINPDNAPKLISAGANELVVGSYLFKDKDFSQAVDMLKNVVEGSKTQIPND